MRTGDKQEEGHREIYQVEMEQILDSNILHYKQKPLLTIFSVISNNKKKHIPAQINDQPLNRHVAEAKSNKSQFFLRQKFHQLFHVNEP